MNPRRELDSSLRLDRASVNRMTWALSISLALHLLVLGGYEAGRRTGLWEAIPAWLAQVKLLAALIKSEQVPPPQPRNEEMQLRFIDVNPEVAIAEPPKDAKFYSSKNAEAANVESTQDTDIPKIDGRQTDMLKTDDVPRSELNKLQPTIIPQERELAEERARPRTIEPRGDLALAKPETNPRPDTGTAERTRPATVKEARSRLNRNQLTGQKSNQDGGVNRLKVAASFDTRASPLGNYTEQLIDAISQRWFDLLDEVNYNYDRRGRIVVQFRLNHDGAATDVKVIENSVDKTLDGMFGIICQKAVIDPSPYPKWPREVRLAYGKDYQDITFAFYY